MSRESRRLAGVLLVVFPTVIWGGATLLWMLTNDSTYKANPLCQDLWRAGHAHAGVLLVLSLVLLRYVDEARLSESWRWMARLAAPIAAILLPLAYFFSMLTPDVTTPNELIYLAYAGGIILAIGLFVLGVGLLRRSGGEQ